MGLFHAAFAADAGLALLLPRVVAVGLVAVDEETLARIAVLPTAGEAGSPP